MVNQERQKLIGELADSVGAYFFICQLCGTAPVTLNFRRHFEDFKPLIKTSWTAIVLKTFEFFRGCFITAAIISATHYQRLLFDTNLGFMTRIIYNAEYVSDVLDAIVVIVGCSLQRNQYYYFFDQIVQVDLKLQRLGVRPQKTKLKQFVRKFLWVAGVFFSISFTVDFFYNQKVFGDCIRSVATFIVPNIVCVQGLFQFCLVMFVVHDRLRSINELLLNLTKPLQGELLGLKIESGKQEDVWGKIVENLRQIFAQLCKIADDLVQAFWILLTLTILGGFIVLQVQFFQLYKYSESLENFDYFLYAYTILWILLYTGKVLMILYAGHRFSQEVGVPSTSKNF